jgi:NAD(P) transhydrogenase
MEEKTYDLAVLGSGPGGEGATMGASKKGLRTAVIENIGEIGGNCTHRGTIPSKALRHSVQQFIDFKHNPLFNRVSKDLRVDFPMLLASAQGVIQKQVLMRQGFYDRNGVDIFFGHGSFLDKNTLHVAGTSGGETRIKADQTVIATGSRPYHPPDIDFDHPNIQDSDSILTLDRTPRSITIFGSGVIGCEYASILSSLDIKINLVNTRDQLLTFLDAEIIDALSYHLRDQGVMILHNEDLDLLQPEDNGVVIQLQSGKKLKSEMLLWANGRTGNSDSLNLESIGIELDYKGNIKVDGDYRTSVDNIFAVGDIVGFPALASASYDQGRYAAAVIAGDESGKRLLSLIPTGIYTSPEISSLGKTERELTLEKVPYVVGHSHFRNLSRAQITGVTVGMLKLLFHRDTLEILGIHCFGYQAAEIIHIGQAVMFRAGKDNTVRYFVDTTFNYPTMAEAYRVAALNGLNRL